MQIGGMSKFNVCISANELGQLGEPHMLFVRKADETWCEFNVL